MATIACLTVFIFLVDICASLEQFLDFGEIAILRGTWQTHSLARKRVVGVAVWCGLGEER
jgi:hypothetical protein